MTIPVYAATGFVSDGSGSSLMRDPSALCVKSLMRAQFAGGITRLTPGYGASLAGDLFLMQVYVRNLVSPLEVPDGWTQMDGPDTLGNSSQYWLVRDARSSGGESGTVIVDMVGNVGLAAIHTMRNVALVSFTESLSAGGSGSNTDTILAPSVTTTGADRLAVALIGIGNEDVSTDFTGETGGNWTLGFQDSTLVGGNASIALQTAPLAAAGSLTGGSYVIGSDENYVTHGFALIGT